MRRVACLALIGLTTLAAQTGGVGLLRSSLDVLRKGGTEAAREAQPGSPADRIVTTLRQTGDARTPWRARFLAAEWLLLAHLERLRMVPVPAVAQEKQDLELAWTLVQNAYERSQGVVVDSKGLDTYRGENATLRMEATKTLSGRVGVEDVPEALRLAVVSLALEIAARRQDPVSMGKAATYASKLTNLSPRDKAFALMDATHGGAWAEAIRWARELDGSKVFRAFHQAALGDPEIFDYSVLLDLAAPKAGLPSLAAPLERREVKNLRLRRCLAELWSPGHTTAPPRRRSPLAEAWAAAHPPGRRGHDRRLRTPGIPGPAHRRAAHRGPLPLAGPRPPRHLDRPTDGRAAHRRGTPDGGVRGGVRPGPPLALSLKPSWPPPALRGSATIRYLLRSCRATACLLPARPSPALPGAR